MTISRSWWPSGPDAQLDKHQAGILISLAIEIDGIDPPRHLDLHEEDLPESPNFQAKVNYVIGKASPEAYRGYCEQLWNRCSHSVKFLYLVNGLMDAVLYSTDIVGAIDKLQHDSAEIIEDWHKVFACMITVKKNMAAIKRKLTIHSILPSVTPEEVSRSLRMEDYQYRAALDAVPVEELPRVEGGIAMDLGNPQMHKRLEKYYQQQRKLPAPSITMHDMQCNSHAPDQTVSVVMNPVLCGVPPYPPIIAEELWVYTNVELIEEVGATQYLVNMLHILRHVYGRHFNPKETHAEEIQTDQNQQIGADETEDDPGTETPLWAG
jgi:hypothetical protein